MAANSIEKEKAIVKYFKCDRIAGFEDEGRVIALEDMPKIEDILGIPAGALN